MTSTIAFASKFLFPIFLVTHAFAWHTCKFHEEDGMCVQLFGLGWNGNHQLPTTKKVWWKRWLNGRSIDCHYLEQQLLGRQQHARLELVREVNLALALFCLMTMWTENSSISTHLLLLESVVFAVSAWDAFVTPGLSFLILPLLGLEFFMVLGLYLQVVPSVVGQAEKKEATETVEYHNIVEPRETFDVIPELVQDLMHESANFLLETSLSYKSSTPRLFKEESTLTIRATKPTPTLTLGILIKKPLAEDWQTIISFISPDGLFAGSELRVGQTLLAINGQTIDENSNVKDVVTLIRQAESDVTLLVTKSQQALVTKPSPDAKVGIAFSKLTLASWNKASPPTTIHKIHANSLFSETNLEEGMQVLAINGEPCPTELMEAANMVRAASKHLTILALPVAQHTPLEAEKDDDSHSLAADTAILSDSSLGVFANFKASIHR